MHSPSTEQAATKVTAACARNSEYERKRYSLEIISQWPQDTTEMDMFMKLEQVHMNSLVWKTWVAPKYKFFAWLVLHNRIWTIDGL